MIQIQKKFKEKSEIRFNNIFLLFYGKFIYYLKFWVDS